MNHTHTNKVGKWRCLISVKLQVTRSHSPCVRSIVAFLIVTSHLCCPCNLATRMILYDFDVLNHIKCTWELAYKGTHCIYIICIYYLSFQSIVPRSIFASKRHDAQRHAFCICRLHKMRVWLLGGSPTLQPGEMWKHIGHPFWSDLVRTETKHNVSSDIWQADKSWNHRNHVLGEFIF